MGKKIVRVKTKKSLLNDEQINYIQKVLENSCEEDICISRAKLFDELKNILDLQISQNQFETAITSAIRKEKIKGFELRLGRNGGIRRKKEKCLLSINSNLYDVPLNESYIVAFILSVLNGKPVDSNANANISVNGRQYKIPNTIESSEVLEGFVQNICNGELMPHEQAG